MQRFVIDIDDHILYSDKTECKCCGRINYELTGIDKREIKLINEEYKKGNTIILYTGRGWDLFELTTFQLRKAGVRYHTLIMGKPIGIYIDKESKITLKE